LLTLPVAFGDGVVGVKALCVDHSQMELVNPGCTAKGEIQSACGVFTEHQVLSIGEGEGLFVGALYCGLHGGAEGRFGVVDDRAQR
jgi:hypothetical protein